MKTFLIAYTLFSAITVDAQQSVSITIDNKIINTTDDRYVSFTIDNSQISHSSHYMNLSDPQLIYLAKQYTPSILRVGGTQCDYTYYKVGAEDPCHLPKNGSRTYSCYSMEQFDTLVSFSKQISADLVFGLSMGYPTYPNKGSTTAWNYSNTQDFLNYIINTKKYTNKDIFGFELGNEVNQDEPYPVPTVQSNAFKKLREILDSMNGKDFQLFGPDTHSYTLRESDADFDYIPNFASEACDSVNYLTYHCYINMNKSQLLTPYGLDEQFRESSRVSSIFNNKTLCPKLSNFIMAGEIAEHNNGGITGVTNTYYDGFWYLDALGIIAKLGQAIFARQTFTQSNYGLLDDQNNPNCDYFTGLLFSNLMSNKVLSVMSNEDNFRMYAHCARSGGSSYKNGVATGYVNLFKEDVEVKYDKSVVGLGDIYLYALTAKDMTSETMELNGNELKLDSNGKLPNMDGKKITGDTVTVPKQSYGFVVFTQTSIAACA
eukprot:325386_1